MLWLEKDNAMPHHTITITELTNPWPNLAYLHCIWCTSGFISQNNCRLGKNGKEDRVASGHNSVSVELSMHF